MDGLSDYHLRAIELMNEIVTYGWGEITFRVTTLKGHKVKITVGGGRESAHFVRADRENKFGEILK